MSRDYLCPDCYSPVDIIPFTLKYYSCSKCKLTLSEIELIKPNELERLAQDVNERELLEKYRQFDR